KEVKYNLSGDKLTTENVTSDSESFMDQLPEKDFESYRDDNVTWEQDLIHGDSKLANNQLTFKSAPLTKQLLLDGKINVDLKVASSENLGMLSFQIVDYGKTKRFNVSP